MKSPFGAKVLVILGVMAIFAIMYITFAPLFTVSNTMNTYITAATANTTVIMTDNGTISTYNEFQGAIGSSLFWIIELGILVVGIIIMSSDSE